MENESNHFKVLLCELLESEVVEKFCCSVLLKMPIWSINGHFLKYSICKWKSKEIQNSGLQNRSLCFYPTLHLLYCMLPYCCWYLMGYFIINFLFDVSDIYFSLHAGLSWFPQNLFVIVTTTPPVNTISSTQDSTQDSLNATKDFGCQLWMFCFSFGFTRIKQFSRIQST